MKKLMPILAVILFANMNAYSQIEWAPIGSEYYYSYFTVFDSDLYYARMVSEKDTIIDGVEAKKMVTYVKTNIFEDEELLEINFIHQDGKKIFRYIRGDFKLLYNLDLELNDTLKIFVPGEEFNSDTTAFFTVDSIVNSFPVNGNNILGHYLNPIDKGAIGYAVAFGGWAFEYFGALSYFFPFHDLQCDSYCVYGFRCIDAEDYFYQRFGNLSCDSIRFTSSTTEVIDNFGIGVYPNPGLSSDLTIIDFDRNYANKVFEISISNVDGTLCSRRSGFVRDKEYIRNPEKPGLYLVEIEIEGKTIVKELIIH